MHCLTHEQSAGLVADRKHESFDNYITSMRKKCAKSHASNQKCHNCTFSQS